MSHNPYPRARWNRDGEPVNLDAAAADALEWLEWFYKRWKRDRLPKRALTRLERCGDALREYLAAQETEGGES